MSVGLGVLFDGLPGVDRDKTRVLWVGGSRPAFAVSDIDSTYFAVEYRTTMVDMSCKGRKR